MQSPEFKNEQYAKTAASMEKQRAKQLTPEYQEKIREQQAASLQRQIKKQNSPDAQAKKKAAQEKQFTKNKNSSNIIKITALKPGKPLKQKKALKRTSMTGRNKKTYEIELHNKLASIGCICCINLGLTTAFESATYVSIHHTNGRTKKEAHEEALPLCAGHHDTPLPTKADREENPTIFPIHAKGKEGGKAKWEKQNGTQEQLVLQCWDLIGYIPKLSKLLEIQITLKTG